MKQPKEKLSLPLGRLPVPLELPGGAVASRSSAGPENGARPACQSLSKVRAWKEVRLDPALGGPRRRGASVHESRHVGWELLLVPWNRLDLGIS